jgi:hypothetical protein
VIELGPGKFQAKVVANSEITCFEPTGMMDLFKEDGFAGPRVAKQYEFYGLGGPV